MFSKSRKASEGVSNECKASSDRRSTNAGGMATLCGASLATLGLCAGTAKVISTIGECERVERSVAHGPTIPIQTLTVRDFEYLIQTESGEELRIPKWDTLAVPARDDAPNEGSVTRELIVSEWPSHIPLWFAEHPRELVVGERYYIVMPDSE